MENKTVTPYEISHKLLIEYYEASDHNQKKYINRNFTIGGTTTKEAIVGLHDIACNKWKAKIKSNHPDCFEEEKYFNFEGASISLQNLPSGFCESSLDIRHMGEYKDMGFYLSDTFDWEICKDNEGLLVLIPSKKKKINNHVQR